ncbi:site-specific recombinase [Solidesulfovibrio magneticus RS-1]|uniref:Site-specific recombinase n=2 Tax=Solidesulfovibrio TaxID=2910984 RepID=C4XJ44_SOLM1|nr:site-specific recombinase [Solidesulfovibrio magneticus RS-1]
MAVTWIKTNFPGVRYYEHAARKHGVQRDRYFAIRFQTEGKRREEGLGWASEGWTAAKAAQTLADLKKAATTGEGPATLAEKRELAEARRKAEQTAMERDARQGVIFDAFWQDDYVIALRNRVKPESYQKEEAHFKFWLSPTLGKLPLREITEADLERVQDKIRAAGLSDRSHEYIMGTFRRVWKHAFKRKIVAVECPVGKLDIPKPVNTRLRVLTPEEIQALLAELATVDQTAHDLTVFALLTGCRASEAFKLRWENVDFVREAALFPETKNREPREVFLAADVLDMLKRRGPGRPGEYVFTKRDGTPYDAAPSSFKTALERLGFNEGRALRDRATFHNLRHSAATYAARRGVPVKDMQTIFGWKTPSMVFRYAKGSEDVQRRAMKGLASAFMEDKGGKVVPFPAEKVSGE